LKGGSYFIAACIALSGPPFLIGCHPDKPLQVGQPLFQLLPSSRTGIDFTNAVQPYGAFNIFRYHSFYDGGGVAIGDVNNDGWEDIFLVSNMGESKLYLNKGDWHFQDCTQEAGLSGHRAWSTGVSMVDINGDGLLDIYICNSGLKPGEDRANQLFINKGPDKNGVPVFEEESAQYGLDDKGMSTQATFLDYDGDGDLDCFVLNNTLNPNANFGYDRHIRDQIDTVNGQRLYRNDHGHFVNVTTQAHIHSSPIGFGLGITVGDLNGDGWPDFYVANDFYERDYLYINNRDGTFTDVIDDQMGHISETSMGVDMADVNNDGRQDIISTDMLPETDYRLKTITRFDDYDITNAKLKNDFHHQFMRNMLQLNNGDGTFSEIGQLAGIQATDWTWGVLAFDFDNDGYKDLFITNGIYKDITDQDFANYMADDNTKRSVAESGHFDFRAFLDKIPSVPISSYAFVNQGNLRFVNQAAALGLGTPGFSSGAAYGDLDNDGDMDLVVNNENAPCSIYRNNESETLHHHFLRVRLKGEGMNTQGIGAELRAYAGGRQFVLQENPQRGFESSVGFTLIFGLGKIEVLDSLVIIWPGRQHKMQVLTRVRADQTLTLYQKSADRAFTYAAPVFHPLYKDVTATSLQGDARHKEDAYVDFDRERLMPSMLSTEGPKCAVGDINGDGLEDFFIGGARNDPGKIFIQTADGGFRRMDEPALEADKTHECVGAAFFDANGDGYLDLMVACGGNEDNAGSPALMPCLYINDGKGHFSCLKPCDLRHDGKMTVFIGGRDVPGMYGVTPRSYLLQGDGKGHFTDVTEQVAPQLGNIGMVTDAAWADIDGDGKPDLVVVGEWMPITIFRNTGRTLEKWQEIPGSSGWWNCIQAVDLDGDGHMDFVIGNLGLNSLFKADSAHPVQLYVNDFDKNGQVESLLTYYKSDGRSYPIHQKSEIAAQLPSIMNKRFLKYADYAGKTIQEIFTPEELKGALVRDAKYLQSAILMNKGNGRFELQALPVQAQFSPVYGILASDLDGDGNTDIFLGGNFYSVKPQIGRYDASYGCLLKGVGKGQFRYIPPQESGLFVKGEVRDIVRITGKDHRSTIVVARNNDTLLLFKPQKQQGP